MSVTALIESIEIPCAITRRAPIIITTMPLASPNNCSHATQAAAHMYIIINYLYIVCNLYCLFFLVPAVWSTIILVGMRTNRQSERK